MALMFSLLMLQSMGTDSPGTANSGPQVDGEADAALDGALSQSPVPHPLAWVRGDRSHARRTRPSPSSSARANRRPLGQSETRGRPM